MFKEGDEVICVVPTFDTELILGRLYVVKSFDYDMVTIQGKLGIFDPLRFRLATPLNKALS